jgi:kynurenine 3-monooxygenase
MASETITVVGAGLAGPLLAISLVQRGFNVEIYERRPDMRRVRQSAGRSINLVVSARGIHALEQAGIWESMRQLTVPMRGRMMHAVRGELTFQPYGKDETESIHSISRADLNVALMNVAEARGVNIRFEERCTGMDARTGSPRFRNDETGAETIVATGTAIAADGSGSAIRSDMLRAPRFNFSQQYLDYGYKELLIPAGEGGKHVMDPGALHIWPRGSYMLIALPNIDATFACILFLPFEGRESFAELDTAGAVRTFFETRFPDAVPLMPRLAGNFFENPVGTMVTVKCSPWHTDGRALLLGDAAHAIVPFFGQGLNCAFEDCTCLLETLDRIGADWPRVFAEFESARKADTDAIADMALENFVEMRDRVADPRFLLRKKVELALEARYPRRFVPKYAMVTFHRIPYATALSRGAIQDRILDDLCGAIGRVEDLDWNAAARRIESHLAPLDYV